MTTQSNSPRLVKAALVSVKLPEQTPTVFAFQYNPNRLTRTVVPNMLGQAENHNEVPRFRGAPAETITLEIELDAADALEKDEPNAKEMGLHAQLAALEVLVYPLSDDIQFNQTKLKQGVIEIIPQAAPLTLFIFGPRRILPVLLTNLQITEELHDADLNPLQARVTISMRVLTYEDFPPDYKGSSVFMTYQVAKETMAKNAVGSSMQAVTRQENLNI